MSSRDTFRPRSGKTIPFRAIDDEEARQRLIAAGIPEAFIPAMLGFYAAYRAGWSPPSGDLERLFGRPATPSLQTIGAVLDGTAKRRANAAREVVEIARRFLPSAAFRILVRAPCP